MVYVPQYNPITIYKTQAPAAPAPAATAAATPATTTVIHEKEESGVSTGAAVGIGLLSFGVGMAVGAALHHDDYPYPAWGSGGVYYGGRPFILPRIVRPAQVIVLLPDITRRATTAGTSTTATRIST